MREISALPVDKDVVQIGSLVVVVVVVTFGISLHRSPTVTARTGQH